MTKMEVPLKQLKSEIKNNAMKIKDSSERELAVKNIIKRIVKASNYSPEAMKKIVPVLKKKGNIYVKKFEKEQSQKESKKEVEKENSKLKVLKKDKTVKTSVKPKKSKKKGLKTDEEEEITDPKLLAYLTGTSNEEFFTKNKLTTSRVIDFVDGLKSLNDSQQSEKLRLFSDKEDIFMQITCFKIPKTPRRMLRLVLPRTIITKQDSVLLFVKDIQKGKQNIEKSEEFHKDLLQKHNVKNISEVMCLARLKNEYDQFEMKRKLMNSHETFLTDGRISGHLAHLLGKIFTKNRKLPTSIKMDAKDLKKEIEEGLRKTVLPLHATGETYIVRIGTTNMKSKHIAENFQAVCTQLAELFPGGWENIRFVRIKTSLSKALPIYVSLKSSNKVKIPVLRPKRPKAYVDVEGELSTLAFHDDIVITPEGTVTIVDKKDTKQEDEEMDEIEEENESEEEDDE